MKISTIAIVISSLIFVSCNQVTKNTEVVKDIGINRQILNAIDSIPYCTSKDSFITIWFTNDTCSKTIRIQNSMSVPVIEASAELHQQTLISEWNDFIGYKKYKNRTLVFLKSSDNNTYSNFINKDSLKLDESPFKDSGLYGDFQHPIHKRIQIVFRIIGKDSLQLLDKNEWLYYYY